MCRQTYCSSLIFTCVAHHSSVCAVETVTLFFHHIETLKHNWQWTRWNSETQQKFKERTGREKLERFSQELQK